ncbi:DUF58 domain-containing protein [Novosphingobium colocasiae]|uniref:DUF58 domain-containing protein n=1 Tax=Novosphingobium colocasiae TaxID=1256513 RepID=A0A918UD79_9SPHN|nr:DUF58 domain-containing protein [Novosphingobium colocasiae]GGY91184.1 hypothetical protein GCM10011614_02320 [Novosphingobium colocasiae]
MSRFSAPIVPTARAAALLALAAPLALVIAAVSPGAWVIAPLLGLALVLLVVVDGLLAGGLESWDLLVPADAEVGDPLELVAQARVRSRLARGMDCAFSCDPRLAPGGRAGIALAPLPDDGRAWRGETVLEPARRGTCAVDRVWLRWTGPLGLGARTAQGPLDRAVRVRPNLSYVRSPALQTFLRDAQFGLIARRMRGEGTQFEALSEYQPGMDRRRIDWKASARHVHLYAKEYETERNNQIVFAFDCGNAMCEPVAGLPRLDRAVSAALATAYVGLRGGDRVSLFGFAARPEVATPFVGDSRAFHLLQQAAAGLEYRAEEPNFTLALATLAARLQRRSLIVLFSEFADPIGAELMIESIGRLVSRHVVLFVTLADEELETLSTARPDDLEVLSMAVGADQLLRQRALVTQRLRQIGVDVIEARYDTVSNRLIDAYLRIKRSGAIG